MKKGNVKHEKQNRDILNVVEDFDCSTQNDTYNKYFKEWRKKKDNPYAFNFKGNKKEKIFNDSRGFEKQLPEKAEKTVINRLMHVVGIAMLLLIVTDSIFGRAAIYLLSLLGLDVHISMINSAMYGDVSLVLIAFLCISMLKLLIPLIYVTKTLNIPRKAGFMSKVNSSVEILNAIGITLIACTVACLPTAYSSDSKEIFSFVRSVDTDVSLWDSNEFIAYTMFTVIVLPVLFELLVHGPMFTALRQFGDPFAIIVTSTVACLIVRDFTEMPAMLMISVIAAMTMLRSGTIMSAFIVNIVYRIYCLALITLEIGNTTNMLIKRNIFMLSALIAGVLIFGTIYIVRKLRKKNKHYIAFYHSDISHSRRLYVAARSYPFLAIAFLCLIDAVVKVAF